MREHPILFSAPMIRALLDGTKTQTRRILRDDWKPGIDRTWMARLEQRCWEYSPYGAPGDRLWVRETWRTLEDDEDGVDGIKFYADGAFIPIADSVEAVEQWVQANANGKHGYRFRPSIHMPRWASRITLEVTGVRVERVQEISEEDARAEGFDGKGPCGYLPAKVKMGYCRYDFATLWDQINGKRADWESNPWVWVVEFKRVFP